MLYQELIARKNQLDKQIQELQKKLSTYPGGYLLCVQNGKYIKNIHVNNGVNTYVPKKNLSFARTLAEKKYLTAALDDLLIEQQAIDSFLKYYHNYTPNTQKLLGSPTYRKMIPSSFKPLSDELAQWSVEAYEKNPAHPDQLRHPCFSGHIVRSKSEALIDQALFSHQIPFRYECALKFDELTFYPDFTIRHPDTGQIFYREHFGMMDSSSYSQNAFQKLQIYSAHGYIPTINLIISFETRNHPLTTEKIETLIQQYFL